MKPRLILLLMAWLTGGAIAMADNFVIPNIEIPQGGTVELPIGFSFDSDITHVGFQLDLDLPEGISTVKDEDGLPVYVKDETSCNKLTIYPTAEDGFGALPQTASASIKGTTGTLITITLEADAALEVGSQLVANVTKAMFTTKDATGTLTSVDIPDFTFNITIGEPDDGRIKFNETATRLPNYTAGETGDVRMTRTITAGQWNTIVLPFTLTKTKAETIFGSDVQLAEFSGFEVDYGDDEENVTPLGITINFSTYTMSARKPMTGGKPFLIKTSKDIESFEADGVTLFSTVTDVEKSDEWDTFGSFTGTLTKTKVPADGLFISNNKFYYSTGNTNIKAFRGWFQLGAVLGKDTNFGVKFNFILDNNPTAIELTDGNAADGAVYDLGGRKISEPQRRGIYIVNGKKVVR